VVTDTEPTFALVGAPYLEYLPVVDLSTGRLLGMEALVRWQHPTHGLISPTHLIPHAEVSGDIGPLTRWILMEACEKACNWSPSIQLGVNCTIHQLRRGDVSKSVARALEVTGFRSGQLTLEVTEDAIVDSSASADLKTLSDMGVQLSVDDVGTNWSSFEPFKRNSISTVKIDGSFIAGLESTQGINRLVVETVIHMAHSLGMSAIVEWVETAAQVEIVRAFNADAAQGFFFSRPMSSDDAVVFATGPEVPQFSRTEMRTLVVRTGADEPVPPTGDPDPDSAADRSSAEREDPETDSATDTDGDTDDALAGHAVDDSIEAGVSAPEEVERDGSESVVGERVEDDDEAHGAHDEVTGAMPSVEPPDLSGDSTHSSTDAA
jgi:EAL domain-containing protein (putative c-di-GMP-specific phosphodiesterase class I)